VVIQITGVSNIGSDVFPFSLFILVEGKEEQIDLEVFNFTGAGGVALSMYNTDEVLLFLYFSCVVTKQVSFASISLSIFLTAFMLCLVN
jgi:hypothetical protein